MKAPAIRVLLADDHTVVREGFRRLLESETDIEIVAEARSGREAVSLAAKHRPDVVVMDIAMPLMNGFEATRQISKRVPSTKVLVLSAYSDDEYVEQVITSGAAGYLIKQSSAEILSLAIREVHKGKTYFSPAISKRYQEQHRKSLNSKGSLEKKNIRLSPREAEVLQLIAEGQANKEIALELAISVKTVEKHRQHLMEKLNIHDTAGLTRYAIASGSIESSSQSHR